VDIETYIASCQWLRWRSLGVMLSLNNDRTEAYNVDSNSFIVRGPKKQWSRLALCSIEITQIQGSKRTIPGAWCCPELPRVYELWYCRCGRAFPHFWELNFTCFRDEIPKGDSVIAFGEQVSKSPQFDGMGSYGSPVFRQTWHCKVVPLTLMFVELTSSISTTNSTVELCQPT